MQVHDPERFAFLARVWEAAPYIVYVYDLASGRTEYRNRRIGELLGYGEAELDHLGEGIIQALGHPEDLAHLPYLLARWETVSDGQVLETEHRLRHRSGEYRWFLGRDTVLDRDERGRVRRIVGTSLEITERKQLEAALRQSQKLEMMGRFASGLAHDFNNLLTSILGSANLARSERPSGTRLHELLGEIEVASGHASDLVRQLFTLAGKRAERPEPLDLSRALRELEPLLRRSIGARAVFSLSVAGSGLDVRLTRSDLLQILLNLSVNARDALPDGGHLDVRCAAGTAFEGSEPGVRLLVIDDGVGMSGAVLDRCLEPFFTTKASDAGTGLGLATVYGLVRGSGGDVRIRSATGEGTSVEIFLPLA